MPNRKIVAPVAFLPLLAAVGGLLMAAKPQPTPTPPPGCTNCWRLATGLNGGTPVDLFSRLVVKPSSTTQTVFAAVKNGSSPGVYQSADGGETFSLVKGFATPYVLALQRSSIADNGRLYAATAEGLYYSNDLRRWTKVGGGIPNARKVTFVDYTVSDGAREVWATVDPTFGTTGGGLYRSTDEGATWALVSPFANVVSIDTAVGCTGDGHKVFAVQQAVFGGPQGELMASADDGATWSFSAVPNVLDPNDVVVECGNGNLRILYVTGTSNVAVSRSDDFGLNWVADSTGIAVGGASKLVDKSYFEVGSLGAGAYSRICGSVPECNPWGQFSTTGLGNLNVTDLIRAGNGGAGGASRFVAATPGGLYYFEP